MNTVRVVAKVLAVVERNCYLMQVFGTRSAPTIAQRFNHQNVGQECDTSTESSTVTSSAPAIDGAFVLSTRGGDFDLQLGTDVSIGYLNHGAETVQLYLQETFTFLNYTAEASVALTT